MGSLKQGLKGKGEMLFLNWHNVDNATVYMILTGFNAFRLPHMDDMIWHLLGLFGFLRVSSGFKMFQ